MKTRVFSPVDQEMGGRPGVDTEERRQPRAVFGGVSRHGTSRGRGDALAHVIPPFHPDQYEYEEIEPRHRGYRHRRNLQSEFYDFG